jgi:hypothetical protein
MSRTVKFLIGLAAALLTGWLYHGPLGHGQALVDGLEGQARAAVERTEVPGISVSLGHDPLSRTATLSGPADTFQRQGQGEMPGLTEIVADIPGIAGVQWADEAPAGRMTMPLLVETLLSILIAYLIGLAGGWLLFGRPRREHYL